MEQPDLFVADAEPDGRKAYYSIREVCEMTRLEPHVLRYWENEFPQLRPKKNRAGNRAYRDKDIDTIRHIKRLLYEEKFTISGAKKRLSGEPAQKEPEQLRPVQQEPVHADSQKSVIPEVIAGLRDIHAILTA
jgi:DNA-binding transcriptional MerR regulator